MFARRPSLLAVALLLTLGCGSPGDAPTPVKVASGSGVGAKERAKSAGETEAQGPIAPPATKPHNGQTARLLSKRYPIVDTHVDVPYRLEQTRKPDGSLGEDVSGDAPEGNFDYPRAIKGGLNAPFMSIYVPARYEGTGKAKKLADDLIDLVEGFERDHPDKFQVVTTPEEVRRNAAKPLVSLPLGMENGSPLEGKLQNLEHFHERGVRYITLAHSKDNHISDSSYDDRHTNGGLSPFGKKVVAEMNRLGMMVDVSHLSDDAFWQVLEVSKAPVIASHSSCRHFTPDWERNIADDMIKALAEKGGVVHINFGSSFLDHEVREARSKLHDELDALLEDKGVERGTPEGKSLADAFWAEHPTEKATIKDVANHIDHVVKLAGIDHVGLGSDFDGVGDSLPEGLEDVSKYPALIQELLDRGYSPNDVMQVVGGNTLRVWQEVIDAAEKG